jgi:hypothetical protein
MPRRLRWRALPGDGRRDRTIGCPTLFCRRPVAVDHETTTEEVGEGRVQAACSCGWRSPVFGVDKSTGTMDPLQQAMDARDLHQWEASLR